MDYWNKSMEMRKSQQQYLASESRSMRSNIVRTLTHMYVVVSSMLFFCYFFMHSRLRKPEYMYL